MSTIIGVEMDRGVAVAADRAATTDGTVSGSVDRVFEFEAAGAAAVGDPGDVAAFGRELRAEIDGERVERGRSMDIERLGRIASRIAADAGVEAVVAARDGDGVARLRSVDAGGAVLADRVAAFGTGAQVALGALESGGGGADAPADRVRDVMGTVADRDGDTGSEIDVWTLKHDG